MNLEVFVEKPGSVANKILSDSWWHHQVLEHAVAVAGCEKNTQKSDALGQTESRYLDFSENARAAYAKYSESW